MKIIEFIFTVLIIGTIILFFWALGKEIYNDLIYYKNKFLNKN